jgi:hypothetical protein
MLAWMLWVGLQQAAPTAKPAQLMARPRASDPAVMAPAQPQNAVGAPAIAAPAGTATAPAAVPALPPAPKVEQKPVAATKPPPQPESAGGCACDVGRGSPSLGIVCGSLLGLLLSRRR